MPSDSSQADAGSGALVAAATVMVPFKALNNTLFPELSDRLVQASGLEQWGIRVTVIGPAGVAAETLKKISARPRVAPEAVFVPPAVPEPH